MKLKTFLSLATFALTFIFSANLASLFIELPSRQSVLVNERTFCNANKSENEIFNLLRQDQLFGQERNKKYTASVTDLKINPKKAIQTDFEITNEYVDASASLDDSDLPRDFQIVWRKHLKAWRDYTNFVYRSSSKSTFTKNELQNYQSQLDELNSEITSTWIDVLDVGEIYYPELRLEIR